MGDGELDGKNAIATMKKIRKIEKNPEDNIIFALTRAISMEEAYRDWETDRKSTRLNSSHITRSRMPSSA